MEVLRAPFRSMLPGSPAFFAGEFENDTVPTMTVHEDGAPEFTGLLDASGVPIYRVPERVPFGFVKT